MMKKIILSLSLILAVYSVSFGQRIAVVDINALLESVTEYKQAENELDKIASVWRQEIAQEYDVIKSMYNKYQAEQVLLSDEVRAQREEAIVAKEKEVREMQRRRFGAEGDLFQKRQELVQPIQERVFGAIEGFADDRGYDLIFDKGGSAGILFTSEEYDKTEDVRKRLQ